ncbi:hypothetical protein GmHk_10G028962 [Glycine max]|nr:hypothetical protein GmHk_10G028962 [Glycine max]
MARTKKTSQMTSEATKEIADNIDSLEEQASGFLCRPWTSGCTDCCHWATRTPWLCACCWSWCHDQAIVWTNSKDLPHVFLHGSQRPGAANATNQGPAEGVDHRKSDSTTNMQSQFQSQMQSQGLILPSKPEVGPSIAHVSTKESYVDPSGNDRDTGDSDKCGLYVEESPPRLVALGRLCEGSTTVHNIPLLHDQVKVGVEEVRDVDAPIPVPNEEAKLVRQTHNTFLAWARHLVKRLSKQGAVGPMKPTDRSDHDVDDPLYLMTLTIPQFFLVMWDVTVFGVYNDNFPLYIKYEDLSEIAHDGQCLSIFVIQLWILHMIETSMRAESYIKNWMQNFKQGVYLEAYLNGAHWKMVVILPKKNIVIWFCSLYNRPDNYLKEIINSALKGLDDTPQSKSKAADRRIVVKYFNDARPLEPERLKVLRIQWAKFYLKS